ncbi:MAG: hypothetical protein ACI93R_003429 [Flavobacteriales bacterium]
MLFFLEKNSEFLIQQESRVATIDKSEVMIFKPWRYIQRELPSSDRRRSVII